MQQNSVELKDHGTHKEPIFIGYLRNQHTAKAIGNYSTRARIHAPIALPLAWEELTDRREDTLYTTSFALMRNLYIPLKPYQSDYKN